MKQFEWKWPRGVAQAACLFTTAFQLYCDARPHSPDGGSFHRSFQLNSEGRCQWRTVKSTPLLLWLEICAILFVIKVLWILELPKVLPGALDTGQLHLVDRVTCPRLFLPSGGQALLTEKHSLQQQSGHLDSWILCYPFLKHPRCSPLIIFTSLNNGGEKSTAYYWFVFLFPWRVNHASLYFSDCLCGIYWR